MGCGVRVTGCGVARCRVRDAGHRVRDAGHGVRGAGINYELGITNAAAGSIRGIFAELGVDKIDDFGV